MVRDHMTEASLLMMNVLDPSPEVELLNATGATLQRAFPSVVVLSRGRGNHMLFAFTEDRTSAEVRNLLEGRDGTDAVSTLARTAIPHFADLVVPPATPVFTDDHAPVEEMTRRTLASFARMMRARSPRLR